LRFFIFSNKLEPKGENMPLEAVPVTFHESRATERVAEEINEILKTGTYMGHIAVANQSTRYSMPALEGVVLLIDRPTSSES
jgi:hypothetical protein